MAAPSAPESSGPHAARIGAQVGSYRVVRYLGKGGMGVVYEAVHDAIGQRAAVKFLASDAALTTEYFRRFTNEARAASAVQHSGLVKVFDFGRTREGEPYLLMEFLEGELLRARIQRLEALPVDAVLRLARQLASALAAVHAQGIVHRDVKPENIIIVADDAAEGGERAKLLDFGIARFDWANATITQPGVVLGTPMYMSPEQCTGSAAGAPSDVYSLGVIVWEMLRGVTPFGPQGALAMLMRGVQTPYLRAADVPEALAKLVEKMLANDPLARPTAAAVAAELEGRPSRPAGSLSPLASTQTGDADARTAGERRAAWRKPRGTAIALAAVLAIGASAGFLVMKRARTASAPAALTEMVWLPGVTFTMGRSSEEIAAECTRLGTRCRKDLLEREQPSRRVTLSPFYLDEHEVTNADVAAWLNTVPRFRVDDNPDTHEAVLLHDAASGVLLMNLSAEHGGVRALGGERFAAVPGKERKPAVQVTWDGARAYCAMRGKRLPTEAEWERAARGDTPRRYPWGDQEPTCDGVVLGRDAAGPCKDRSAGPEEIGAAPQDRTADGIRGLGGNVSEWVEDAFTLPYYPDCGGCVNPRVDSAVTTPSRAADAPREAPELRVFRGAAWNTAIFARTTSRGRWSRTTPAYGIGFRCAADTSK